MFSNSYKILKWYFILVSSYSAIGFIRKLAKDIQGEKRPHYRARDEGHSQISLALFYSSLKQTFPRIRQNNGRWFVRLEGEQIVCTLGWKNEVKLL
jgi:hypothetical protein